MYDDDVMPAAKAGPTTREQLIEDLRRAKEQTAKELAIAAERHHAATRHMERCERDQRLIHMSLEALTGDNETSMVDMNDMPRGTRSGGNY